MVKVLTLVTAFAAVANALGLQAEEDIFAALLKRQAPGTPSYNCHDNCGQAITLSRRPDPCKNEAFKANYNNCLQCAGPDNYNIWRMYGNTLSTAGSNCGFSTTPLSGKQPDVGPAVSAGGSSASASIGTAISSGTPTGLSSQSFSPTSTSTTVASSSSLVVNASPSRNATASATGIAPPQQSTNSGSNLDAGAGEIIGAVFLGALFGLHY